MTDIILHEVSEETKEYDLTKAGYYCRVTIQDDNGEESDSYYEDYNFAMNQPLHKGYEVHPEDSFLDEEVREEELSIFFMDAPYYLLLSNANMWGEMGYRIEDNRDDILNRYYDCCIYPEKTCSDRKVFVGREYSHDAPLGGSFYVIALSCPEYEEIEYADYDETIEFANSFLNASHCFGSIL